MRKGPVVKHLERTESENTKWDMLKEVMSTSTEFSDSKYLLVFE